MHSKSDSQLDIIFNALPQSLSFIRPDFIIERVNKNFLDLYGVTQGNVVGRYCYEACFGRTEVCEGCLVQKAIQTGKIEKRIKTYPNGEICEMTAQPIFDDNGVIQYIIDMRTEITDFVHKDIQIQQLQNAINQSADEFWLFDKSWRVLYANKRAKLNCGDEELQGKNISEFTNVFDAFDKDLLLEQLINERRIELESECSTGEMKRTCELNMNFVSERSEYIYCVVRDISERKKHEVDLIHQKEIAEHALNLKSTFLANISHEIRTPLNAVIGFSKILNDEILSPDEKEYITNDISSAGNDLLNIFSNIIEYSKYESGNTIIKKRIVRLGSVFKWIEAQVRHEVSKHVNISFSEEHNDICLFTDEYTVTQIIKEFIQNSIKYTLQGDICIKTKSKGDKIKITIKDSGIGIPKQFHESIFDPFFQIDTMKSGVGIGLTLAKHLSEKVGTTIEFYSAPGIGSEFSICFPIYEASSK